MKLALVRQRFTDFGGAEQYLGNLARRLAGLGHEVHLLAREWPTEKESGLILHRIKCGGPSFLRMRSFARQAASLVKEAGFDLVHSFERTYSQDIFRAGDGCHAEWLLRRARAQGRWRRRLDRVNPKHRAFLDLEARLFSDPRLKLVLANSQRGRAEVLQHYGWPESRVRVLYNGLDHDRFHPGLAARYREEVRAELGLSRDEPAALFVGSGFARKGLGETIRALKQTQVRLVVAGKDRNGPFRRLAAKMGVFHRVMFLGPRLDVERLYGAADLFVLPSWYEPFSNACLEAAAAGLPLVTTKESGAAEIIQEGVNGYTVSFPTSAQELAEKINLALTIDRSRLAAANQTILAPFTWENNLNQTLAAYQDILGRL